MAYKLEHFAADHLEVLKGTLLDWSKGENDVYIVSNEGHKIFTQKILLYFYSCNLGPILDSLPISSLPSGISVSASSTSISNLLKLLTIGEVTSEKREALAEVKEAGRELGINLGNCQLDGKKNSGQITIKKILAKPYVTGNAPPGPTELSLTGLADLKKNNPEMKQITKKWNTVIVAQNKITHVSEEDVKGQKIKSETPDTEKQDVQPSAKCDLCFKVFREKRYLRRHRFRKHKISLRAKSGRPSSGPNPIPLLNSEVKSEVSENLVVRLPCGDCEKEFDSKKKLYKHRLQHTNNYTCDQCEKSFPTPGALRLHKNIHLDVLPFQCDICDKGFAQAGNLKTHKIRYHDGDMQQSSNTIVSASTNEEVSEEVVIGAQDENEVVGGTGDKCGYCDEHFDDSAELNAHMILMHSIQEMIQSSD